MSERNSLNLCTSDLNSHQFTRRLYESSDPGSLGTEKPRDHAFLPMSPDGDVDLWLTLCLTDFTLMTVID